MRFQLDTHIVVRWLSDPKRLSREQLRTLREAVRRGEPVGLSAISLIEIATLRSERKYGMQGSLDSIFAELETNPFFRVLPITIPIAREAGAFSVLRDPADRTIVATARVHRLHLLTSDQRIMIRNLFLRWISSRDTRQKPFADDWKFRRL